MLELRNSLTYRNVHIGLQIYRCKTASSFGEVIQRLAQEVIAGEHFPVLHIECYGKVAEGLRFADGIYLSWPEVCESLRVLNRAMKLSLLVSIAACYGDSLIQNIPLGEAAPCMTIIGPSDTVLGREIHDGFLAFYLDLFVRLDADKALEKLLDRELENGSFGAMSARMWFSEALKNYLFTQATEDKILQRANAQFALSRNHVNPLSVDELAAAWRRGLPLICEKYFNQFFMADEVPDCEARYGDVMPPFREFLRMNGYAVNPDQ